MFSLNATKVNKKNSKKNKKHCDLMVFGRVDNLFYNSSCFRKLFETIKNNFNAALKKLIQLFGHNVLKVFIGSNIIL